jgi:hypothetical protein
MSKANTPRKRTLSFEGTKVSVVASILRKWAAIPLVEKLRLIDAAYEEDIKRHRAKGEKALEEAFKQDNDLHDSVADVRHINLSVPVAPDGSYSNVEHYVFERDPAKLRIAADKMQRAADELRRRADSIESRPALWRGNEELRLILVRHWVSPNGVCLCWMSYPALAKFLRLTCPRIDVHSVTALEKECQRLGLPKLPHPLVEESQIRSSDKGVHLAG